MNEFDSMIYNDMTWSFSRLDCFDQCPLMWHKIYIDCEPKRQNAFAQYGSLVHSIIERLLKGEIDTFDAAGVFEKEFAEKITVDFPPIKNGDLRSNYYEKGLDYFSNLSANDDIAKILGVEEEIRFEISGKPFIGYIDLRYLDRDGNMVIQDQKSSNIKFKKDGNPAKASAEKMKHYEYQVYLYSKPFIESGEKVDRLRWNFFNNQTYYEIPWTANGYKEAINWAEDRLETIGNEALWLPKPDWYFCHNICDVSEGCEYKGELVS